MIEEDEIEISSKNKKDRDEYSLKLDPLKKL